MENFKSMIISGETQFILSLSTIALLVIAVFKIGSLYNDLRTKSTEHENKITQLEKENNLIKITQAVLNTKLENIEAGVVEIKAMLTTHLTKE